MLNVYIVIYEYVFVSERFKFVCIIIRFFGRNMSFKVWFGICG